MAKQVGMNFSIIYKYLIAIILLIAMFFVAMMFGATKATLYDIWLAITTEESSETISVIRDIRLPREIAAVLVGAGLAISGAVMQGITRNPLADPGLLGLTAGANAMLAISFVFFPNLNYFGIIIVCFFGSCIGAGMVFSIGAFKKEGLSPFHIVLAGAAVSAFLYAVEQGFGLYFKVSKDISMWTAGGLQGTTWTHLKIIIPFILLGVLLAIVFSKQLTVLSFNEEVAIGLGQNIMLIKTMLFIIIVLLAGSAVALVGNLVFIGLMIPHIVRAIVGADYRLIIPMAAIIGAIFMLFTDTIARTIHAPYETPIIAIVAIIGLPFFLFIVRKGGRALS